MVFNGDTAELGIKRVRSPALAALEALRKVCRVRGVEPIFLNGNHDPEICSRDHLELMDGRLLVAHGHALFPAITPWGRDAADLLQNHRRALEEMSGRDTLRLEDRLEAVRQACLRTPMGNGKMARTKFQWWMNLLSEMARPLRVFEVFRAWMTVPSRAAAFAAEHRPRAECVVIGHTHLPGFWRRDGRMVMNTGAYFPWLGRRVVDLSESEVVLRLVEEDNSRFRPGREVVRWSLKRGAVPQGTALSADRAIEAFSCDNVRRKM